MYCHKKRHRAAADHQDNIRIDAQRLRNLFPGSRRGNGTLTFNEQKAALAAVAMAIVMAVTGKVTELVLKREKGRKE